MEGPRQGEDQISLVSSQGPSVCWDRLPGAGVGGQARAEKAELGGGYGCVKPTGLTSILLVVGEKKTESSRTTALADSFTLREPEALARVLKNSFIGS